MGLASGADGPPLRIPPELSDAMTDALRPLAGPRAEELIEFLLSQLNAIGISPDDLLSYFRAEASTRYDTRHGETIVPVVWNFLMPFTLLGSRYGGNPVDIAKEMIAAALEPIRASSPSSAEELYEALRRAERSVKSRMAASYPTRERASDVIYAADIIKLFYERLIKVASYLAGARPARTVRAPGTLATPGEVPKDLAQRLDTYAYWPLWFIINGPQAAAYAYELLRSSGLSRRPEDLVAELVNIYSSRQVVERRSDVCKYWFLASLGILNDIYRTRDLVGDEAVELYVRQYLCSDVTPLSANETARRYALEALLEALRAFRASPSAETLENMVSNAIDAAGMMASACKGAMYSQLKRRGAQVAPDYCAAGGEA